MPIRVQVVTERWNPVSAAIRYTTRSWASHVEFIDTENHTTLGARALGGVQIRPCSLDHYSRVEQFVVEDYFVMTKAYLWCGTQIGKQYDYSAILGIRLNLNLHDPKRWFCAELIAAAFEQAGYPLLSTRPSNAIFRITPRDLLLSRELFFIEGEHVL